MAVNNNLYPGIVSTYAPAFLINSGSIVKDTCRVYFSISQYNSLSDMVNAQVTVTYQNNNKSALNRDKYPCDIMLTNIMIDNSKISEDKYYIEIKKTDMDGGNFEINQYYKVQFRFTGAGADSVSLEVPQAIDSWLTSNLQNFSEWSTVCLVRGIAVPKLSISGLEAAAESTIWTTADTRIVGELTFADPAEKEVLKSYQIKLYNAETEQLVSDSGLQYTSDYVNVNQFNYTFPYEFNEGQEYYLTIEYTTNDLYSEINEYSFTVIQNGGESLNATISAKADNENGCIKVHLEGKDITEKFTGNITIRRTSSDSHFQLWEDVYTTTIENKSLQLDFSDFTVESGIWYKYCAQRRDSLGNRGIILSTEKPVMVDLEFFYLSAEGKQIKINFNHSISSFKRQIAESKADTLGSKYPFISRNAVMDYKTFPIAGTISYLMDEEGIFASENDIFGEEIELYKEYNQTNRIGLHNNYIYERKFRDLVSDFLHKNNIKLFRSATEGNILVKLMDINFTPNQVLGGYIYDFSCTAYEMAECTQENINKYNIQPIGDFSRTLTYLNDYFGQSQVTVKANEDVLTSLQNEYAKYVHEGYVPKVEYLDTLKLEFEGQPYLINEDETGPYVVNDKTAARKVKARINAIQKSQNLAGAYLGYLVYINNEPVVINPEGIFELKGENVRITSLTFPVDTQINIEYHLQLSQTEDLSQLYKSTNYFNRIGQYWGAFGYEDSIYQQIWNKYYQKYSNYMQAMTSLSKIRVEAEPGTVVYTKEAQDDDFERHVIGQTCTLDFGDDETLIEGVYFSGIHLEEATAAEQERDNLPDNKYIETGIEINTLNGIENPIKNGVYTLVDLAIDAEDTENPDTVIVDDEDIENTNRKLNNDKVNIKAKAYDKNTSRLTINFNQVQPNFDDLDNCSIELIDYKKDNFAAVLQATNKDKNVPIVSKEFITPIEETVDPDDYNMELKKAGEHEHGIIKAKEDLVKEQNEAYIGIDGIAAKYYRLLANKDYDKEFALLVEELINSTNKYIWYNNHWWAFTKDADLICPVEGLIDYYCEVMKGNYAQTV